LSHNEAAAFLVFAEFAHIEGGDRAVIAHHAGPDFAALAFVIVEDGDGRF
jgi:hypothetical protein